MQTETKVGLGLFTLGMVANVLFSDPPSGSYIFFKTRWAKKHERIFNDQMQELSDKMEKASDEANHPKDQSKHCKEFCIPNDVQDAWRKKFLQDTVTKTSDTDHQDSDDFVY